MLTFIEPNAKMKGIENCLDSELWHACAGGMVQMPKVNSAVYYFPQGHAEHASGNVDFRSFPKIPAYVLCRVSAIKFLADCADEVFAKIQLVPRNGNEVDFDEIDGGVGIDRLDNQDKPASFAKTLTQSDANNGGGFSVPRYCAETIFPRLDYSADPPVQTILAKDVHGESWNFRHIYRGTPRRHLLTTGWSTFVNNKKLTAGDSVVFLRTQNEDLCVGIRRAKRGVGSSPETSSGWNQAGGNSVVPYGGFSCFLREDENRLISNGNGNNNNGISNRPGPVKAESVLEAVRLAANGQPFEVVYYPRASTPEFCVRASLVKAALQIRWCPGMRFKMPFETEDSSRISWFMGTISSVKVADAIHWPDSPWRLLQITWDEPDLLQNVKRVNPWLVELVANMPAIHFPQFAPPRKKLRLPQHPDVPPDGQLSIPTFSSNHFLGSSNPFRCLPDDTPAGMQGARHAQYSLPIPNLHPNKLQLGLFSTGFLTLDRATITSRSTTSSIVHKPIDSSDNVCCLLTMGNSTVSLKEPESEKAAQFVLFGQPILTEQQISRNGSRGNVSPVHTNNSSSDGNASKTRNTSDGSGSSGNVQTCAPE